MAKAPLPAGAGLIHVFCARPGLRRAGVEHPTHTAHKRGAFTAEQLAEMVADPLLTVVVGDQVTAESLLPPPAEA